MMVHEAADFIGLRKYGVESTSSPAWRRYRRLWSGASLEVRILLYSLCSWITEPRVVEEYRRVSVIMGLG